MDELAQIPLDHSSLPDIAKQATTSHPTTLNWVGMNNIALPITLDHPSGHKSIESHVQICVNLNNPSIRGIHMSRLYLLLTEFANQQALTPESVNHFLHNLLASHEDISDRAKISFQFNYLLKQPALKSQYSGWKKYPATIKATYANKQTLFEVSVEVPYSSTCPCSAALAEQKVQQKFSLDFSQPDMLTTKAVEDWLRSDSGSYATPHSQRSCAKVCVKIPANAPSFDLPHLISTIETTLKTPVQTAVKREDEQAFAELNGQNLMFCEDAARRLKASFNQLSQYLDFWIRVEHYESLHAHDAISFTTKGIPDGFTEDLDAMLT